MRICRKGGETKVVCHLGSENPRFQLLEGARTHRFWAFYISGTPEWHINKPYWNHKCHHLRTSLMEVCHIITACQCHPSTTPVFVVAILVSIPILAFTWYWIMGLLWWSNFYYTFSLTSADDNSQSSHFVLTKIAGNISICSGCRNKYSKNPVPPDDLCIKHQEWREFTPSGTISRMYITTSALSVFGYAVPGFFHQCLKFQTTSIHTKIDSALSSARILYNIYSL